MSLLARETCRLAISIILLWASCFLAQGATYYVAPNGSDDNPGTNIASPFRTLACTVTNMVAGDTCWLRSGIYRETLAPVHSGTPKKRITFAAYPNETVTLSGADEITGWQSIGNGTYAASVSWDLGSGYNQVFVDSGMLHQAQYPAFGAGDLLHPATVAMRVNSTNPNLILSSALDGRPDNFWVGSWVNLGVGERWSWQCAQVVASSGDTLLVAPATRSNPWFTGEGRGLIWGLAGLLDSDDQWHLQNQLLSLRLGGGADPTLHSVEMKRRPWCINLRGHSYITIRGLRLFAGAVSLSGNGNALEHCEARYLSHYMRYVWGYSCCGDLVQGSGVVLDGTNNTVRGCTIFDTAGSGIISSGAHNAIVRNRIYNTDYSGTYACAIRLNGVRDDVICNTACSSGRDILQPAGAGHLICLNDLSQPGKLCRDLGVIYFWGINGQCRDGITTRIAYNWVHDNVFSGGPAPLIYADNWCRNFFVDHNVCWNSAGDSGIRINAPATGLYIYNNTLFNCDDVATHTYNCWPALNPDPLFWTQNLYSFSGLNNLFLGSNPQTQLCDWVHNDFQLRPGAPAVGRGVYIPEVTQGAAPDLGAYESTGHNWKPGADGSW